MPKVKVNDISLYYEERGEGFPLVLVAGFGADHFIWSTIIDELAKDYRVICFDNRGVGRSDSPDVAYTVEMMSEDLLHLCQALTIESAFFIGHSLGGAIVQNLAYHHPELIQAVVLSNTFTKIDIRFVLYAKLRLEVMSTDISSADAYIGGLGWLYSSKFLQRPNLISVVEEKIKTNPHLITEVGYRNQLNALYTFDSTTWSKELKACCLVIGAERDMIVNKEQIMELTGNIKGSSYYFIADTGHVPHVENPTEFCNLVLDYFKRG